MPNHPYPPLADTAQPAPASPAALPPTAASENGASTGGATANRAALRPPIAPGPGEEATTVLPRRPFPVAGPAPFPPVSPGMPAWGPPPGYPPLTPPRRALNGKGSWIVGAVAVAVVTACAGLGVHAASGSDGPSEVKIGPSPASNTTSAQPAPSTAPAATMPLSGLPGVILDVATINNMLGASDIVPRADVANNDTQAFTGGDNDHPECGGVQNPALQRELDNSGYLAVRIQSLSDPRLVENIVHTGAIYFSTAKAANDFVAKQAQAWPKCNGVTLHPDPALRDGIWMIGTVTNRAGMLTVINTQEGAEGWQCQRALTARNNVVLDVQSCGFNRTDQAITIATRMGDRVTPR